MMHHGERLRLLTKAKGYSINQLAGLFDVSRAAIEKHFKAEKLSRKILLSYSDKFGFSVDEFYSDVPVNSLIGKAVAPTATVSTDTVPASKYIELQAEHIDLQKRYTALLERFFPNAAQRRVQRPMLSA